MHAFDITCCNKYCFLRSSIKSKHRVFTVFPERSALSLDKIFVNAEAVLTQHVAFCVCITITGHCSHEDPTEEEIWRRKWDRWLPLVTTALHQEVAVVVAVVVLNRRWDTGHHRPLEKTCCGKYLPRVYRVVWLLTFVSPLTVTWWGIQRCQVEKLDILQPACPLKKGTYVTLLNLKLRV